MPQVLMHVDAIGVVHLTRWSETARGVLGLSSRFLFFLGHGCSVLFVGRKVTSLKRWLGSGR